MRVCITISGERIDDTNVNEFIGSLSNAFTDLLPQPELIKVYPGGGRGCEVHLTRVSQEEDAAILERNGTYLDALYSVTQRVEEVAVTMNLLDPKSRSTLSGK